MAGQRAFYDTLLEVAQMEERPIWENFSKKEFDFYDPYDRY